MSRSVDIGIEERRTKPTQGRHRSGKSAHYSTLGVFYQTNSHIIIHLILTYYFSELNYTLLCYFILFMALPERDKEGFTLVDRKRQKRKAEHSSLLHTPPRSSSTSTPGTPTRPKSSNFDYPNTVPVIFRDADSKFKTVKQVMSELSQYHPELRVSRVKDLPNKGFFIIGNAPRDIRTLQSESKMKACLGQNLKISLPIAYQIKEKSKTLVVKGVPTEFTNDEFKDITKSSTPRLNE